MNRTQKVLTVIALIAFVVIGAGHYLAWSLSWPPLLLYENRRVPLTVWKELTYQEAQQQIGVILISFAPDLKTTFVNRLQEQGGYTDSKGQYHTYPVATPAPTPPRAKLATDSKQHPKDGFDLSYSPGGFDPRQFDNGVPPLGGVKHLALTKFLLTQSYGFRFRSINTNVFGTHTPISISLASGLPSQDIRWFRTSECRGSCSA
jgi:hypothetical protein